MNKLPKNLKPNNIIPAFGKLFAYTTPSGKQVIKLPGETITRTAVRYPKSGTIVETIVHRFHK